MDGKEAKRREKLKDDLRKEIRNCFSNGWSVKKVTELYSIGKTLAYQLRSEALLKEEPKRIITSENYSINGDIVGIIGDSHEPYSRPGYYEFCHETFKNEGVTRVLHIGDLVDNHNWSRFATEPDAESGISEFERAFNGVQRVKKIFREWDFTWILGNHDRIPVRQLKTLGLPSFLLKSLPELFDVREWEIGTSKVIDNTAFMHGIGCMATLLTAQRIRRSMVCGHSHTKADIQAHAGFDDLVFGMHVGSGIDDKAYAFRYAKENVLKSIISCGTVAYGVAPKIHFMPL